MQLPGGLRQNSTLHRDFAFRPVTGEIELAIAEIGGSDYPLPEKVTAVLATALHHVGNQEPSCAIVQSLAVADRQFLMRRLSVCLGMGEIWLTAACVECGKHFDFFINQSKLPVKEAGKGFPFVNTQISAGRCRLRVPNGGDQVAIAAAENCEDTMQLLARRCMVHLPDNHTDREEPGDDGITISPDDVLLIEIAIEEVAPEVSTRVQAACPECNRENIVDVDPYMCLGQDRTQLFSEIHTLASTYHWSEAEILSLPKSRRQRYLKLIDRSRGMVD